MKDWKVCRQAYHLTTSEYADDLNQVDIVLRPDHTVEDALRHFREYVDQWIYPGKSFAVAICYATWLVRDYGEDFYQVLDDSDLMYGNDPYFVPYSQAKDTYDAIIDQLVFDDTKGMVPDIREYYKQEMIWNFTQK